jgi:hypothetical protein
MELLALADIPTDDRRDDRDFRRKLIEILERFDTRLEKVERRTDWMVAAITIGSACGGFMVGILIK